MLVEYFMRESQFKPEIQLGFIRIDNAHKLPMDSANLIGQPGCVSLVLHGATGKPNLLDSFVSIQMFTFPTGRTEFERVLEWYGADRKSRAKLPEGVKFDEQVLAFRNPPTDWLHEAYPLSGRSFIHIYQGKNQAMLVRWLARTGTILDHPLFKPIVDNLSFIPGEWITDKLEVDPLSSSLAKGKDSELPKDIQTDLQEAAMRARKALNLGRIRNPLKLAEAIHQAIEDQRSRKKMKEDEKKNLAIDYGALWGEALCGATGWEWRCFESPSEGSSYAVCSKNRSHLTAPLRNMFGLLSSPKTANNSLLLFNMISSGNIPESPAKGYCWLN